MKVVLEMVGSVRCSQCTDLGPARGWRLKDCLSTRMCLQSIVTADIETGRARRRGRVSQVGEGMVMLVMIGAGACSYRLSPGAITEKLIEDQAPKE